MKMTIIGILSSLLLISCSESIDSKSLSSIDDSLNTDFIWDNNESSIILTFKSGIPISHCIIYYSGEYIDCCENKSIDVQESKENSWLCTMRSCYDDSLYKVKLTIIGNNELELEMLTKGNHVLEFSEKKTLKRAVN